MYRSKKIYKYINIISLKQNQLLEKEVEINKHCGLKMRKNPTYTINGDTALAGKGFLSSLVYLRLMDNSIDQSPDNF